MLFLFMTIHCIEVITIYNNLAPNVGYVEFIVNHKQNNKVNMTHELSKFHREDGRWPLIRPSGTFSPAKLERRNTIY